MEAGTADQALVQRFSTSWAIYWRLVAFTVLWYFTYAVAAGRADII